MDTEALREVLGDDDTAPTIVCAAAGNVNTGACDDMTAVVEAARAVGAWVHVDGAFGLWAAASPRTAHLVRGIELADPWACDGHKWLNVPYDAGYAICADPEVHATALAYTASYLTGQVAGREFGGGDFVPESSRRARGFATWRPYAPSGARASPPWSTDAATSRVGLPNVSTSSTASKSSTTSSSIRCSSVSETSS